MTINPQPANEVVVIPHQSPLCFFQKECSDKQCTNLHIKLPYVGWVYILYHINLFFPLLQFTYIMPKLYKSLVEYETLFKRLQHVELDFPDDPYNSYKTKRKLLIQNALDKLASTIQEITDSMEAVKLTVTPPNKNKLDLSTLESKVDATQCLRNDYLAFRGYKNLLNNWHLEFHCRTRKGRQAGMKATCRKYEAKLQERSNSRSKGHKSKNAQRVWLFNCFELFIPFLGF